MSIMIVSLCIAVIVISVELDKLTKRIKKLEDKIKGAEVRKKE